MNFDGLAIVRIDDNGQRFIVNTFFDAHFDRRLARARHALRQWNDTYYLSEHLVIMQCQKGNLSGSINLADL